MADDKIDRPIIVEHPALRGVLGLMIFVCVMVAFVGLMSGGSLKIFLDLWPKQPSDWLGFDTAMLASFGVAAFVAGVVSSMLRTPLRGLVATLSLAPVYLFTVVFACNSGRSIECTGISAPFCISPFLVIAFAGPLAFVRFASRVRVG